MIKANGDLTKDFFDLLAEEESGITPGFTEESGAVKKVDAEQLEPFLHQNQNDALASGVDSQRVKQFFDYIGLHVFLPWLRALTESANSNREGLKETDAAAETEKNRVDAILQITNRFYFAPGEIDAALAEEIEKQAGSSSEKIYLFCNGNLYYISKEDILREDFAPVWGVPTDVFDETGSEAVTGKAVAAAIAGKADRTELPETDQEYNSESANAQSGKAVASAIAEKADRTELQVTDQEYNSESANAQSGKAVAAAIAGKADRTELPETDQEYNSESANAQSGKAVAEALVPLEEAAKNFLFSDSAEQLSAVSSEISRRTGSITEKIYLMRVDADGGANVYYVSAQDVLNWAGDVATPTPIWESKAALEQCVKKNSTGTQTLNSSLMLDAGTSNISYIIKRIYNESTYVAYMMLDYGVLDTAEEGYTQGVSIILKKDGIEIGKFSITSNKFVSTHPVSIHSGGTGATNAADARKNLGIDDIVTTMKTSIAGKADLAEGTKVISTDGNFVLDDETEEHGIVLLNNSDSEVSVYHITYGQLLDGQFFANGTFPEFGISIPAKGSTTFKSTDSNWASGKACRLEMDYGEVPVVAKTASYNLTDVLEMVEKLEQRIM